MLSYVFERFTERARLVVVFAQEEARLLKFNYIGSEHILLGLLREQSGISAHVLESLGITLESARAEVVRIVGSGEEAIEGHIPFTPRAKKILELALREGLSLGHNYINTEHILLGLVRENEGVATRVLLAFDADAEKIRNAVIRLLPGSESSPGSTAATGGTLGDFSFVISPDRELRRLLMAAGGLALSEQRIEFGLADLLAVAKNLSETGTTDTSESENPQHDM